jgi:hypothetical protein
MQARKPHAPQDGKTQPSAGRELGSCASVLHPRGETLTTTDEILLSFVDLCVLCGNGFGSPRNPPAEANAILHSNTLAEAFILISVL